jgi:hypothetical protein
MYYFVSGSNLNNHQIKKKEWVEEMKIAIQA